MPRVIRAMRRDGDFPLVAPTASGLGARPHDDIPVDALGFVFPGTGGMSVVPIWQQLPYHRIPKRMKSKFPRATGSNELFCWQMGEGSFVESSVNEKLSLKPDRPGHGTMQPISRCTMDEYQESLAETRGQWLDIESQGEV